MWYKDDQCVCVRVCVCEENGIEYGGDTLHNGQKWMKLLHIM